MLPSFGYRADGTLPVCRTATLLAGSFPRASARSVCASRSLNCPAVDRESATLLPPEDMEAIASLSMGRSSLFDFVIQR